MAGVVSPSMWMFKLVDPQSGAVAYCTLNEGLGKVLRYGAFGPEARSQLIGGPGWAKSPGRSPSACQAGAQSPS